MAKGSKKRKKDMRAPSGKRKVDRGLKRAIRTGVAADIPQVTPPEAPPEEQDTALARISQLEADRTNLMAQVAWARGIAQEQQKALESERSRTEKLEAELAAQRLRVEQLKSLSALDRLLGRHKRV